MGARETGVLVALAAELGRGHPRRRSCQPPAGAHEPPELDRAHLNLIEHFAARGGGFFSLSIFNEDTITCSALTRFRTHKKKVFAGKNIVLFFFLLQEAYILLLFVCLFCLLLKNGMEFDRPQRGKTASTFGRLRKPPSLPRIQPSRAVSSSSSAPLSSCPLLTNERTMWKTFYWLVEPFFFF